MTRWYGVRVVNSNPAATTHTTTHTRKN